MSSASPETSPRPGQPPFPLWGVLAILAILAFAIRILNWPVVLGRSSVVFLESDAFYHMRRILAAVHNRLQVPDFDFYLNFPTGFHCNWPPLFDQFVALLALILGFGHPSDVLVERVGALVPPMLGALTVVLAYFAARPYLGSFYAVVASGVLAVLPYSIQISVAGRPDHHVAIALLSVLLFLTVLRLGRQAAGPRLLLFSALAGLVLSTALGTWTGSLLFVIVLYAHFQILILLQARDRVQTETTALQGTGLFLFAALFLLPIASHSYWGAAGLWSWDGLSLFHPLLLTGCGAVLWGSFLLSQYRWPWKSAVVGAVVTALVLFLAWLIHHDRLPLLAGGPSWLLKQDPMLKEIQESFPLTGASAQENFTRLVLLFPLVGAVLAWRRWKGGQLHEALLLCLWAAATGGCTLLQERFSDVFSFPAALFIAGTISLAWEATQRLATHLHALPGTDHGRRLPYIGWALGALLLIFTAWPTGRWLVSYARSAPAYAPDALYETCLWLRNHTPAPGRYEDFSTRPDYSVMATWELGNAITYLARRPNVANNFLGWSENRDANLLPYRFFATDSLADGEAILDERGVRYVVVSEPVLSGQLARMIDALGLDPADFFEPQPNKALGIRHRAASTLAFRLYIHNGQYLDHFRLVFESRAKRPVAGELRSVYKIFEYDKWGLHSTEAVQDSPSTPR